MRFFRLLLQSEMQEIREFMVSKHVPEDLQRRVRKYRESFFHHRRAFDERAVLANLPPELMYHLCELESFLKHGKSTGMYHTILMMSEPTSMRGHIYFTVSRYEMMKHLYANSIWAAPVFRGLAEEVMAEICFSLLVSISSEDNKTPRTETPTRTEAHRHTQTDT